MTLCNKRQPRGVRRCELPKGHKGEHASEGASEVSHSRVLEWFTWPNDRDKPKPPLSRSQLKKGKGPRAKSDKQDARDNAWNRALCYAHLALQEQKYRRLPTDAPLPFFCETCGGRVSDDIEEALDLLQPGHVSERRHDPSKGVRFYASGKVKSIGTDTFENVKPQCSVCNSEQHHEDRSDPEFGRTG